MRATQKPYGFEVALLLSVHGGHICNISIQTINIQQFVSLHTYSNYPLLQNRKHLSMRNEGTTIHQPVAAPKVCRSHGVLLIVLLVFMSALL